jgi:Uma2 family endonuclease
MAAFTLPVTRPRPVAAVPAEQRIAIRGLSWDLYNRLSEAIGADQHVRLTFDGKDLEIMVTGPAHEDHNQLLSDFLTIVAAACGIRSRKLGQTTWKRPAVERGLQADQCVYFDRGKLAAVARARTAGSNDVADYPNPDLAIEIDISQSQVDRPGIYAALKIPEVWRFNGDEAVIEQLGPDGHYAVAKRSQWLPVRPEDLRRWLVDDDSSDDVEWKQRLTKWAQSLAAGGNGA